MVWEVVGNDPPSAATARLRKEKLLDARAIGIEVSEQETAGDGSRQPLDHAIADYLKEVKASKSKRTFQAYSVTLKQFADGCEKAALEDINRADILAFKSALTDKGNVKRTVSNRLDFLKIFFNRFELKWPLLKIDRVKYTEKTVSAYSGEEIKSLMAASDRDEVDLFQFLLCTGVREQEAMFATWRDVDFDRRTFHVSEKLDLGFTPKDKEEAEIPIPDSQIALLKARRNRQPKSRLIFPHSNGEPNGHFLRVLKSVAFRAGMNCGECFNKAGQCCATDLARAKRIP